MNDRNVHFLLEFNVWLYTITLAVYILAVAYFILTALNNLLILYGIGIGMFILGFGVLLIRRYKSVIKKDIEMLNRART